MHLASYWVILLDPAQSRLLCVMHANRLPWCKKKVVFASAISPRPKNLSYTTQWPSSWLVAAANCSAAPNRTVRIYDKSGRHTGIIPYDRYHKHPQ